MTRFRHCPILEKNVTGNAVAATVFNREMRIFLTTSIGKNY